MYNFKLNIPAYIFCFDKSNLILFEDRNASIQAFSLTSLNNLWKLECKDSFYEIAIINDYLYLDGGSKTEILNIFGEEIENENSLNFNISLRRGFYNFCIIRKFGHEHQFPFGIFNLKTRKVLNWILIENLLSIRIVNDFIFGSFSQKNERDLMKISENGQQLWHFNLDSLYESHASQLAMYNLGELSYITEPLLQINNLIGVLNNLLWVDVDVQMRGSFLLALDTETGAVVHLLQTTELQTAMPEHLYYYNRLGRTAKSHLDAEQNMLIGFSGDFDHWQVDLSQPEPVIKFWYLEENFKDIPEGRVSQIDFSGITPTHIFFPNSHGHFPQVIAFNRKTMQVDWRQVFNDEKGYFSPKQVKANDTHLFVHMSDNSLHIFEKTED